MSKLPVVSGRDLVRALCKIGFVLDRQKGSHMMLFRAEPPTTLSVPDHPLRSRPPRTGPRYAPCSTSLRRPDAG